MSVMDGASPPPLIGQRLGTYRIDSLLGRGAMGEVYPRRILTGAPALTGAAIS